jgi:mannosyl-oligosaccharide glucosidase
LTQSRVSSISEFRFNQLTVKANGLTEQMTELRAAYPHRIDAVFSRSGYFNGDTFPDFSQSILSNLLGGLGFFHGSSMIDTSNASEYAETDLKFWETAAAAMARANLTLGKPQSLISHTPSRPSFPRGFLWDEGFHLLTVIEWDFDLAVNVLRSWLALMDDQGWIAREQILGPEARSIVPPKFHVQYPHFANPPTLILLVTRLISKITKESLYMGNPSIYLTSPTAGPDLLRNLYPQLSLYYGWFCRTQTGLFNEEYQRPEDAIAPIAYRWRGRTPLHTLTSGLDDYPRATPPHPGELHVDALAWVGAATDAMQQLAEHAGEHDHAAGYSRNLDIMRRNLDALHWDRREKAYCDATVGSDGQYQHVCHLGYVSLMPFVLGHMNATHPNLGAVLDLMSDKGRLWTPYGLRSLSRRDPNYGGGENYWRGAIWVNVNILAALQLRELGEEIGPHQERAQTMAKEISRNIVDTVHNSWAKTGSVWEQYSDLTGEGKRSEGFTGWSACVLLLMGMGGEGGDGRSRWGRTGEASWLSTRTLVFVFGVMVLIVMLRRRLVGVWRIGVERFAVRAALLRTA